MMCEFLKESKTLTDSYCKIQHKMNMALMFSIASPCYLQPCSCLVALKHMRGSVV